MKIPLRLFLIAGILAACTSSIKLPVENTPISSLQPTPMSVRATRSWWEDAVFYEIFVRSFYDSNGDGIGDFNGITEKLDYLHELGVTAIWLMPIQPSASYHGYDVINYVDVNPDYGTLDDFKHLLTEAHKRGLHVIIDLVLNHTSDQNPWFIDANNNPQSPYRNWYIWSDTDPGYLGPLGAAWHPGKHGWYYGIFNATMPDLNYNNPVVTAEMEKVVQFWLNSVGVDGFRIDAANYLIEEGQKQVNTQSTHKWFKGFYSAYKADNPDAFTVGEVYGSDAALASTYTDDEMDMIFNFELAADMVNSVNGQTNSAVDSAVVFAGQSMPDWNFATFLTNHDQDRLMTQLGGSADKVKAAASMLLTAPGVPFLYYGEEVGLEGGGLDELKRRPMQWSAGANAGFSTVTPWEQVGPGDQIFNVTDESKDPTSILADYRELLQIRNQHAALRQGDMDLVTSSNAGLYSILRVSRGSESANGVDEAVLVLINLTNAPISNYDLSLDKSPLAPGSYQLVPLMGSGLTADLMVTTGGEFAQQQPVSEIPSYGTAILQLQPDPPTGK
ncbi:MAG: alpha-amylase family glycosyl hydrolase [Anaerolineales bacterium]|jgi:glycosidase